MRQQLSQITQNSVSQAKTDKIADKYPNEIGQILLKQCLKCTKTINKMKVIKIFEQLESTNVNQHKKEQILKERFEWTNENAAMACCRNGHVAVLKVIVETYPDSCKETDYNGNLALHHLCMNTTSKKDELEVMLEIINDANSGAKEKENDGNGPGGIKLTPMDILTHRFEE